MPITSVRETATAARPSTGASAAELKTASHLKTSVRDTLKLVRFGAPLTASLSPKSNAKGEWKAPNGDRLVRVVLSTPPAGTADGMSTVAFVNPKTNQFYQGTFGGIGGLHMFHGPVALPAGKGFKPRAFTAADIASFTAAANGGAPKTPTKTAILNALGAYDFHNLTKWSNKGPSPSLVLKQVALKKDGHPDGFSYTGLVLRSDPNKVVIMRTGGFAGITQYTQTFDVTRLPK